MHQATLQLQFFLVAALSLLGLAAVGAVLFIKAMERRGAAAERPHPALAQSLWQRRMQVWLGRYAIAAAALAVALAVYGLSVFARN